MDLYEGGKFSSRVKLHELGLHNRPRAGIDGNKADSARAIVLSGGYVDDDDQGNTILYTGEGGQDPGTRDHVKDQTFSLGNEWLAISQQRKTPVRVFRKTSGGYEFGGHFLVEAHWRETSQHHGFIVYRYRLEKLGLQTSPMPNEMGTVPGSLSPPRVQSSVWRIARTKAGEWVKEAHGSKCQMCSVTIRTAAGLYAHAAHVMPLGRPHHGPDTAENILCLCPNHHVMFDVGGTAVAENLQLLGMPGVLRTIPRHRIGREFLAWHREYVFEPMT